MIMGARSNVILCFVRLFDRIYLKKIKKRIFTYKDFRMHATLSTQLQLLLGQGKVTVPVCNVCASVPFCLPRVKCCFNYNSVRAKQCVSAVLSSVNWKCCRRVVCVTFEIPAELWIIRILDTIESFILANSSHRGLFSQHRYDNATRCNGSWCSIEINRTQNQK